MGVSRFADPNMLWLLLLALPMAAYYILRVVRGNPSVRVSTVQGVRGIRKTFRYYLRHLPFVLLLSAVSLMVVALARPQRSLSESTTTTEGVDIMLVMDVSTSMLAADLKPNRIAAARDVASKFIVDRVNDRIGIVVFAGESFTQCPLTTDKGTLLKLMGEVREGVIEDGTAIGNGLATAVNRLRDSDAASRVVVLLTDGVNNAGQVTPLTAADIAVTYGIRVYTIGVGSRGKAPYPVRDFWGNMTYAQMDVDIDEEVLTEISERTGGEYFRATDNNSLAAVYERINELEKSRVDTYDYMRYEELYRTYLLPAAALLLLMFLVRYFILRTIP